MLFCQEALSKHFVTFFTPEPSHFPPWFDRHSLLCEMIMKSLDRGRFTFETLNTIQFEVLNTIQYNPINSNPDNSKNR